MKLERYYRDQPLEKDERFSSDIRETEKSIFGAILSGKVDFQQLRVLNPEDFCTETHKLIFLRPKYQLIDFQFQKFDLS